MEREEESHHTSSQTNDDQFGGGIMDMSTADQVGIVFFLSVRLSYRHHRDPVWLSEAGS